MRVANVHSGLSGGFLGDNAALSHHQGGIPDVNLQRLIQKLNIMRSLPVSKKFYSDIVSRINAALSCSGRSAAEAIRLVDAFLCGDECDSSDAAAMLAFRMIRDELVRAMSRSARARERAKERREAKAAAASVSEAEESVLPVGACEDDVPGQQVVEMHIPRRQRRAEERARRGKKAKWRAIM